MAEVFKEIDTNMDGHISVTELIASYEKAFGEEPT